MKTDFEVQTSLSVVFLTPVSNRAEAWIYDNLELENWQGSDQIPIEPRMFEDIKAGIILAGMKIEYI
jgi:hypothetical protein